MDRWKKEWGQARWSMRKGEQRVGPFGQCHVLDLTRSEILNDPRALSTWIPLTGVAGCRAKDSLTS